MKENEHYAEVWKEYLQALMENPCRCLTTFLRDKPVSQEGMSGWMQRNGLSVSGTKRKMRQNASMTSDVAGSTPVLASATGGDLIPLKVAASTEPRLQPSGCLEGVSVTFPDGIQVSIKRGGAHAVMEFIKLYREEEAACLV